MDNVISGSRIPDKISFLYNLVKRIFDRMSFSMRAWASNVSKFSESIPERNLDKAKIQKVLGIAWQLDEDEL